MLEPEPDFEMRLVKVPPPRSACLPVGYPSRTPRARQRKKPLVTRFRRQHSRAAPR
jgi:hypothetical protein